MNKKIFIFVFLLLYLFTFNFCDYLLHNLSKINNITYHEKVYVQYINGTPYFYVGEKKEYYIEPLKINSNIYLDYLKELNFVIDNESYSLIITNKDINTTKYCIIVINKSKTHKKKLKLIWLINPLNLNSTIVNATTSLPNKGEIIAIYENGSPAAIRIKNKIYVGFELDKYSLANLIYIFSIKKVNDNSSVVMIILTSFFGVVLFIILFEIFKYLKNKYLKLFSYLLSLPIFIIGKINVLDEEKVLLNDTRRMIYNYILDNPGCHLREIARNLNISVATAIWHLRILEKANLVISEKIRNKIVYYPSRMDLRDLPLIFVKSESEKKILEYLLKNGDAYLRKIARDLNMNVETVRYNLKKLEKLGLIESYDNKNKIYYKIKDNIKGYMNI